MSLIVVALGGNALGYHPDEQKENVNKTAVTLVKMMSLGHQLIITHGNGPQVGLINLAFEEASKVNNKIMGMPFPECGAMSQGYIGYHLQNAMFNKLKDENITPLVTSVITQVEVDVNDENFLNPTKPIGAFYSKEVALELSKTQGYVMKEDAGRGYRRVIASPKPVGIVELEAIKTLLDKNFTIICVGGGGIPVGKVNNNLIGVDAVIDKDFASSFLARKVDADMLLILTAVDEVSLNYGKPNEVKLSKMSVSEARIYLEENHFANGSMKPKIEAAIEFVQGNLNKKAIIASLDKAIEAIELKRGTLIYEE